MRKLIYLFFAVVLAASCRAQSPGIPIKTAGIVYSKGVPQWVPQLKSGSEIDIDTTTGHIYQWHRTNNSWLQLGQGIDQISGVMPPLYTPVRNMSLFAINGADELYHYSGSAWSQINQGTAYTAGVGIDITGNEITNTAPDQTVSITGSGISSVTGTYPNFTVTSTEVDGSTTNEIELPAQTGNGGKYLTTDGSSPSWGTVSAGITGSATAAQIAYGSGTNAITSASTLTYNGALLKASGSTSQFQLGDNAISSNHKVMIELDATRSQFQVRNSSNGQIFFIRNDGVFGIGDNNGGFVARSGTASASISGQFLAINPTGYASTSDQTADIGSVYVDGRLGSATSGYSNILSLSSFNSNFTPSSGTRQVQCLLINPTYNQTGSASGAVYGIRYKPTVTSVLGAHYGLIIEPNCRNGIGTATPAASAALDITSTTTGFLPPRMTTAQRNAISSPATGLTIYCTDATAPDGGTGGIQIYNGSVWGSGMAGLGYSSIATNQIPYGNGTSAVTSTSNFNYNPSTGRLGVGTASPTRTIHTAGTLRFDSNIYDNQDNALMQQSGSGTASNRDFTFGNSTYGRFMASFKSFSMTTGTHPSLGSYLFYVNAGTYNSISTPPPIYFKGYVADPTGNSNGSNFIIDLPAGAGTGKAGSVGVGTSSPNSSAAVDITSTTAGFLPPRMTTAQRNAISSPATGLTIYCTDATATDTSTGVMQTYNGSTWKNNW